jgi:hypothetical protein
MWSLTLRVTEKGGEWRGSRVGSRVTQSPSPCFGVLWPLFTSLRSRPGNSALPRWQGHKHSCGHCQGHHLTFPTSGCRDQREDQPGRGRAYDPTSHGVPSSTPKALPRPAGGWGQVPAFTPGHSSPSAASFPPMAPQCPSPHTQWPPNRRSPVPVHLHPPQP